MNIEDQLKPETTTELALFQRINDLRRMLYEGGNFQLVSNVPTEAVVSMPAPMVLKLAASVKAGWEQERFAVTARSYGGTSEDIGFHYYLTGEVMKWRDKFEAVRDLENMHRHVTRQLSRTLMGGKP